MTTGMELELFGMEFLNSRTKIMYLWLEIRYKDPILPL